MCDLSDRKQCAIPSNAQRQGMCNSNERHAVINIYSIHVSFLHLILPTITFFLNMHTHQSKCTCTTYYFIEVTEPLKTFRVYLPFTQTHVTSCCNSVLNNY